MGDMASTMKTEEKPAHCVHYKRRCKLVAPCCSKIYTCRICHDEGEDHQLNRKEVQEIVCTECELRQKVGLTCTKCEVVFGNYTCLVCNLFDDEDKNQFHCDGCGICRIGGRDKFFHCPKCNMCLPVTIQNDHKCIENVSHADCPVCLEDIHTSRLPSHIPKCGHLLHKACFDQLIQAGMYTCPQCQVSLLDMTRLWRHIDGDIANTPMPEQYRDMVVQILCKDCQKKCVVKFHVLGHKCEHCGSYNTCRIKAERLCETGESSNGDQNEWEDVEDSNEEDDEEQQSEDEQMQDAVEEQELIEHDNEAQANNTNNAEGGSE